MYFDSLQQLWAMDGHGPYVWSAYAISLALMLALVWQPLRKTKQIKLRVQQLQRRAQTQDTQG